MATRAKVLQIVNKNGAILEVVGVALAASKMDLMAWVSNYKIEMTSVRDPDGVWPQSKNLFVDRERYYIVNLGTMKIVNNVVGDASGRNSVVALNMADDDIIGRL